MGLFSWLRGKKKKQTVPEVRQAGVSGNVQDEEGRRTFYKECGEFIEEAIFQSEQAKNEYGLVTNYLSDVQRIETLSGTGRAEVESAARSLIALEDEKARTKKQEPGISDVQKGFFALHEREMPETSGWLRGEEERQRSIEGKMKYLAGEKALTSSKKKK